MRLAGCALVGLAVIGSTSHARADEHELPPVDAPAPRPKAAPLDLSILGGLGGGVALLAGKLGEPVGPAGAFRVDVGARFLRHVYATAGFELALFSEGGVSAKNVSSWLLGARGGWLTNPDGFGAFADLGLGFRNVSISDTNGTALTRSGADVLVGAGLHFKFGDNLRLFVPRVDMAAGSAGGDAHALFTIGLVALLNYDVSQRPKHD